MSSVQHVSLTSLTLFSLLGSVGSVSEVVLRTCATSTGWGNCSYAFDNNPITTWGTDWAPPQWLEANLPFLTSVRLGSYAITVGSGFNGQPGANLAPLSWVLEGYNGLNEALLDQVTVDASAWRDGSSIIRELSGSGSYERFRLIVHKAASADGTVAIAELQLVPYATFDFQVSPWGPCSVTCGGGSQSRDVICLGSDGVTYSHQHCSVHDPPPSTQECNIQPCGCLSGMVCNAPGCRESSNQNSQLGCGVTRDGQMQSAWVSNNPAPQWLVFDLGASRQVTGFAVTSENCTTCLGRRLPQIIGLSGSNDGAAYTNPNSEWKWITLAKETVTKKWGRKETRYWPLSDSHGASYRFFRFNFLPGPGDVPALPVSAAQVGLYGPIPALTLQVGQWTACFPFAGQGSCGNGQQERTVYCQSADGTAYPLLFCPGSQDTLTAVPCIVTCPEPMNTTAAPHPSLYGVIQVTLRFPTPTAVTCYALSSDRVTGSPMDAATLASSAASQASHVCSPPSCTLEILGAVVAPDGNPNFQVWCTVKGSGTVFPQNAAGMRVSMAVTPTFLGCYGDDPNDPDLTIPKGRLGSEVLCSAACKGHTYFGLQGQGFCFCGDSYGLYGPRAPNRTSGLPGCNCVGPYFGYMANCVWQQPTEAVPPQPLLQSMSVLVANSTAISMLLTLSGSTWVQCWSVRTGAAEAEVLHTPSAPCGPGSCQIALTGLLNGLVYNVTCKADARDGYLDTGPLSLLLQMAGQPAKTTTGAPQNVTSQLSSTRVFQQMLQPGISANPGPGVAFGILTLGAAVAAFILSQRCCCRSQRRQKLLQGLANSGYVWMLWELLITVDWVTGLIFLLDLVKDGWDQMTLVLTGTVVCAGEFYVVCFVVLGVWPAILQQCKEVGQEEEEKPKLPVRTARQQRYLRAGSEEKAEVSALGILHYLPPLSMIAVCFGKDEDLRAVAVAKVQIQAVQVLVQDVAQVVCCYLLWSSSGRKVSAPSIACGASSILMILLLSFIGWRVWDGTFMSLLRGEGPQIDAFDGPSPQPPKRRPLPVVDKLRHAAKDDDRGSGVYDLDALTRTGSKGPARSTDTLA